MSKKPSLGPAGDGLKDIDKETAGFLKEAEAVIKGLDEQVSTLSDYSRLLEGIVRELADSSGSHPKANELRRMFEWLLARGRDLNPDNVKSIAEYIRGNAPDSGLPSPLKDYISSKRIIENPIKMHSKQREQLLLDSSKKPKDLNTTSTQHTTGDITMAIAQYFDAKKRYEQETNTRLQHIIQKSVVDAQEAFLKDPATGLIDYSQLETNVATRTNFKNAVAGSLEDAAMKYFAANPANPMNTQISQDPLKKALLTFGYLGMSGDEVRTAIESAKGSFTLAGLVEAGTKAFKNVINPKLQAYVGSQLTAADEPAVRALTGVTPARHAAPIEVPQMSALLEWYGSVQGYNAAAPVNVAIPDKVMKQILG